MVKNLILSKRVIKINLTVLILIILIIISRLSILTNNTNKSSLGVLSVEDFVNIKYKLQNKLSSNNQQIIKENTDNFVTYTSKEYADNTLVLVTDFYSDTVYIAKYKSISNGEEYLYLCTKDNIIELNEENKLSSIINEDNRDLLNIKKLKFDTYSEIYTSEDVFNTFKNKMEYLSIQKLNIERSIYGGDSEYLDDYNRVILECSAKNKTIYLEVYLDNSKISNINILKIVE